jgi:hypothetical protein
VGCGAVLIFNEDMTQRQPTSAEIGKLRSNPKSMKAIRLARQRLKGMIAEEQRRNRRNN